MGGNPVPVPSDEPPTGNGVVLLTPVIIDPPPPGIKLPNEDDDEEAEEPVAAAINPLNELAEPVPIMMVEPSGNMDDKDEEVVEPMDAEGAEGTVESAMATVLELVDDDMLTQSITPPSIPIPTCCNGAGTAMGGRVDAQASRKDVVGAERSMEESMKRDAGQRSCQK